MLKLNYSQIKYSKEPVTHIECDLQVADDFIKRSHGLVYQVDRVLVTGDYFIINHLSLAIFRYKQIL